MDSLAPEAVFNRLDKDLRRLFGKEKETFAVLCSMLEAQDGVLYLNLVEVLRAFAPHYGELADDDEIADKTEDIQLKLVEYAKCPLQETMSDDEIKMKALLLLYEYTEKLFEMMSAVQSNPFKLLEEFSKLMEGQ